MYGFEVEELERVARAQRGLVLDEAARVDELLDPLEAADGEVMAALRADPQVLLELVVAVVGSAAGTGVRVLLRRPVVESGLLVLDRDVDLVGGGHLRHLRPAFPDGVQAGGGSETGDREPGPARRATRQPETGQRQLA